MTFLGTYLSGITGTEKAAVKAGLEAVLDTPIATRAAIATLASPTNGQTVYLTEAVYGGQFIFSTADLSAEVTLDTEQGVYVAPASDTTGASGAWVRVVEDNTYQASWFGTTAVRTDNEVCYNCAGEVLPDGATLIVPPYTHSASAGIVFKYGKALHLKGTPRVSHIVADPGALAAFTSANNPGLVTMMGSKSSCRDLDLTGPISNVGSGEPPALQMGKNLYLEDGLGVPGIVEDMLVENVHVRDGSAGIRHVANFRADVGSPTGINTQSWDNYDATYRPVTRNCVVTAQRIGLEYYAVIDGRDENNFVTITDDAPDSVFDAGIRILGCQGFTSTGTVIEYEVEVGPLTRQNYGVYVAGAGINDRYWQPSNENVAFFDLRVVNANRYVQFDSFGAAGGTLLIDGALFEGSMSGTIESTVFASEYSSAVAAWFRQVTFRNITIRGGAHLCNIENPIKHLVMEEIDWIANAITADTSVPMAKIRDYGTFNGAVPPYAAVGGYGVIELKDVRMKTRHGTVADFYFQGLSATTLIFANGCWTSADFAAGSPAMFNSAGCAAGCKIITDGSTQQDMAAGGPYTANLNYRYPAGMYVKATT